MICIYITEADIEFSVRSMGQRYLSEAVRKQNLNDPEVKRLDSQVSAHRFPKALRSF